MITEYIQLDIEVTVVKDYLKELDNMNIKELKIPTWNELLGIEDNVRFRFIYEHFMKSNIYIIINNKLLFCR